VPQWAQISIGGLWNSVAVEQVGQVIGAEVAIGKS
jgi:hypothetical protein